MRNYEHAIESAYKKPMCCHTSYRANDKPYLNDLYTFIKQMKFWDLNKVSDVISDVGYEVIVLIDKIHVITLAVNSMNAPYLRRVLLCVGSCSVF